MTRKPLPGQWVRLPWPHYRKHRYKVAKVRPDGVLVYMRDGLTKVSFQYVRPA